jgi:hypothetical protein
VRLACCDLISVRFSPAVYLSPSLYSSSALQTATVQNSVLFDHMSELLDMVQGWETCGSLLLALELSHIEVILS